MQALARIPSGVFLIHPEGSDRPVLLSWVQQCSFDPPRIVMAINKDSELAERLTPGTQFNLSILGENQRVCVDDQTAREAHAELFCSITHEEWQGVIVGDHRLFTAEVISQTILRLNEKPYVHIRKTARAY